MRRLLSLATGLEALAWLYDVSQVFRAWLMR
jgi:hypothetical protein